MSTALWMAVGIAGAAGAALAGWYISRRQMPALRALDADFQCPDIVFTIRRRNCLTGWTGWALRDARS